MSRLGARAHSVADKTLQAMAKVVTNRRWAATATAMALGFGLFIGVAIGPGASGSLAGAAPQIVEVPPSSGGTQEEATSGGGGETAAAPVVSGGGESAAPETPVESFPSAPLETATLEPFPEEPASVPAPTKPAPEASAPEEEETEPEGQTLTGTVVHANPAAGSYALAIKGGELVAVHSAKLPPAGTKLSLPVEQLANGTFAEQEKPDKEGEASKASFTGTVTFADPDPAAPTYTVSGRGASVLVRVEPDPAGAVPALPPLGSFATVDVRIGTPPASDPAVAAVPPAPLCELGPELQPARSPKPPASALWQQKLKVENVEPSTYLEVAGVVSGLCTDRPALLLSGDDAGDGADDLLLAISPKVNAAKLQVADSIVATIEIAEDGTLTLTGLASDERAKGADDAKTAQGDLKR